MPRSPAARTSLRYHVLTAVMVAASVLLAIAGFFALVNNERETVRKTFERVAADQAALIEQGVRRHVDAVYALAALYASSQQVERDEFHSFVQPFLARAPGIQALEWIPRVPAAQRKAFEKAARADYPAFHFTEREGQAIVRAGPRTEYFPVYFMEPYAGNETALGYDLGSDQVRRAALKLSCESGVMTVSGRVRLVQEAGDEYAVVLFQPIYRHTATARASETRCAQLLGFVLAVIKPQRVVAEIARHRSSPGLDIALNDELAPPGEQLLLFHAGEPEAAGFAADTSAAAPLHFVAPLDFGARRWSVSITPAPGHYLTSPSPKAWAVLVAGLAFAALIAASLQIIRSRVVAVIRANEALESSRRNLAAAQRIAQLGSWETRLDSPGYPERSPARWSDEVYHLLGREPGKIEANTAHYLAAVHPADRDRMLRTMRNILSSAEPRTVEHRLIRPDGEVRVVLGASEIVRDAAGKPKKIIGTLQDITERHRRQQELQRFRAALDVSSEAILLVDRDTARIIDVNETACRMLGYTREELLRMEPHQFSTRMDRQALIAYYASLGDSGETDVLRGKARRKDGSLLPVEGFTRIQYISNAWVVLLRLRDISDLIATEQLIADYARHQGLIAALGQRALESTDLDPLLQHAVEMVANTLQTDSCDILELEPDKQHLRLKAQVGLPEPWGEPSKLFPIPPGSRSEQALSGRRTIVVDNYGERPPGAPPFDFRSGVLAPVLGATGICGLMVVNSLQPRRFTEDEARFLQSVTNIVAAAMERHSAEQKLSYLAQFDTLTGLPNRHMFHDFLTRTLAQRGDVRLGCMFVDLDRFKYVNDTFGHAVGDQLLSQVSRRLRQCVRSADMVGRLGGDEFAVLLTTLARPEDASLVAQKIIDALVHPFDLDGQEAHVTASIGIALHPGDGDDAGMLLKNADAAMYLAKEQGRNGYQFYLPEMNERAVQRQQLEMSLHAALQRDEFTLHYQPKVDLALGTVSGFEALLRWRHPERGLISPHEFIPALEDTGLIVPVGEWVLQTVCGQIKAWQEQGIEPRPVAINISARQYQQQHLDTLIAQIQAAGIAPAWLKLELTESQLMQDADSAALTLAKLKAAGVRLSVDDFGTGYSSLAYLKRFPVDELKIDRAFIRDVTTDPDDAEIAVAIIRLAHSLRLSVVAEGVETAAQLYFLRTHGCDEMQGYYFAPPLSAEDCTRMLIENRIMSVPSQDDSPGSPGILVVDDNPDDLALMRRALERESYRVMLANSAHAAFDVLSTHAVDVVISDYNMPGMSGVEFLARVREIYPDILRIALSGSGDATTVTDAVNEAGVHKYLVKTLDARRILKEVREALLRRDVPQT